MRHGRYIITAIFILTLAARLIISFQTPFFTGDESYFSIRQAEHISQNALPIYDDELSYSGRENIFMPLFYYLLAFFNLFMPIGLVGKIIPNILVSLNVILVYVIAMHISNDEGASLFSAFVAGFIPVFFRETVNTISPYTIFFPLMLFMIYCFLRLEQHPFAHLFLASLFLMTLTSPAVIIVLLALIFYMGLVQLENLKQNKREVEMTLFSILFVVWILFIVYKKAFLMHGPDVIWQNIPAGILDRYFIDITILGAIYQIGSLPLSYGIYSIYDHLFRKKERKYYLIIGLVFSSALLLWLKLIEIQLGLMCLGIAVTLLFPKFYKYTFQYIKKTRFAKLRFAYFAVLLAAFLATSVVPSVIYGLRATDDAITPDEYGAMIWLRKNTDQDAVVMSPMREGMIITTIAERRNIADSNFMLLDDAEKRFNDIKDAYTTGFEIKALEVFDKYDVDYIYFSDYSKDYFETSNLEYTSHEECFEEAYNQGAMIYKVMCELR
ncbi:hypothetical protein GF345_02560 [Candidatus Woesearchaeota archaeon]|nr:hypothetical protein [Candidatus Woesearchaeota archaeon]